MTSSRGRRKLTTPYGDTFNSRQVLSANVRFNQGYKAVKDAVLFAIDISNSMLTPRSSSDPKKPVKESPATAALKCAYHLMQQRIISNPRDMIGVLLFGTQESKFYNEDENSRGDLSYPHCYLFTDLDVPSAHEVKELRALAEDEGKARDVLAPSEERVSMANVLFCANQVFTSKAPNFTSRRLFIVTDDDNPHGDNKSLRSASTVRAKDLYDLGVIIELFPISRPEFEFDNSKFYDVRLYYDCWIDCMLIPLRISSTRRRLPIQRPLHICSLRRKSQQRLGMGSHYSTPSCPISIRSLFLSVRCSRT